MSLSWVLDWYHLLSFVASISAKKTESCLNVFLSQPLPNFIHYKIPANFNYFQAFPAQNWNSCPLERSRWTLIWGWRQTKDPRRVTEINMEGNVGICGSVPRRHNTNARHPLNNPRFSPVWSSFCHPLAPSSVSFTWRYARTECLSKAFRITGSVARITPYLYRL